MKGEIDKEIVRNLMENPFASNLNVNFAFLYLEIDRSQLIEDALNSLVVGDINFRKPLKIKFKNEPGVDEGGV